MPLSSQGESGFFGPQETHPNIASPDAKLQNFMRIEGGGEGQALDEALDRNFESLRYNIGKNTKQMVTKIFKAASSGND